MIIGNLIMQYKLKFPVFSATHENLYKFNYNVEYFEGTVEETALIDFLSFMNSSKLPISISSSVLKNVTVLEAIDNLIGNFSMENQESEDYKNIVLLFRSKITPEHLGIFSSMLSYTQPMTFELDSNLMDKLVDNLNQIFNYVGLSLTLNDSLGELSIFSIIQYSMLVLNYYNLLSHINFNVEQHQNSPGIYALLSDKSAIMDHLFFMLLVVGITDTINTKFWVNSHVNKTIKIVKSQLATSPAYKNIISSPKHIDKREYDKLLEFIEENNLEQYNLLPTIVFDGLSQEKRVQELFKMFTSKQPALYSIIKDFNTAIKAKQKRAEDGRLIPFLYNRSLLYNDNIANLLSNVVDRLHDVEL